MAGLSNYLEQKWGEWLSGTNFPVAPTPYVRLYNGDPGEDGLSGTDVTTLIRVAGGVQANFSLASNRATSNSNLLDYGNAQNSTPVDYWAIFDDPLAGNMLIKGPFSAINNVTQGENFTIQIGDLDLSGLAGAMEDAYVHAILNWIGGTSFPTAPVGIYSSLWLGNPKSGGVEKSSNFANGRAQYTPQGTNPIQNSNILNFGADSVGEDVDYTGIHDAQTGGNRILSGPLTSTLSPDANDVVRFPVGTLIISLD